MSFELFVPLFCLVVAIGVVVWVMRRSPQLETSGRIAEILASRDALQGSLDAVQSECNELTKRSAASEAALEVARARVGALEAENKELSARLSDAISNLSASQVKVTTLTQNRDTLSQSLEMAEERCATLTDQLIATERNAAALQASLVSSQEALRVFKEGQSEWEKRFEKQMSELGGRLLNENSEKFRKASKEEIDTIIAPLRAMLDSTKQQLQTNEGATKAQTESLRQQLERIISGNETMSRLFRGENNKALGNMGEHALERILNAAGLSEHTHYTIQSSYQNEESRNLQPDVTVMFPDNKRLFIDSKVSIKSYSEAMNAPDEKQRERYIAALVKSLEDHVEGLSKKRYDLLGTGESLDFVLMFVPFEQAYLAALEQRPNLAEDALRKNVAIVTNSTLLATLRTVSYIWKQDLQQKNMHTITNRVGKMLEKFELFLGDMYKVGAQLSNAQESYDSAVNRLTKGRGNLAGQMRKLQGLGSGSRKVSTNRLWEEVDIEEDEEGEAEEIPGIA
jgi:DNA recombination protein RmuC